MIQLNYKEARPLYEQIKESIRKMVISNAFLADEKLPSVREMASQLAVNPNAIERAYQELEQDGYVYRRKDEGFESFCAPTYSILTFSIYSFCSCSLQSQALNLLLLLKYV